MYTYDGPRIGPRLGDEWTAPDFNPDTVVSEEDSPQTIPQDDPLTQLVNSLRFFSSPYPAGRVYVSQQQPQRLSQTQWLWLLAGGLVVVGLVARK